jgi:hypothetical protein
MQTWERSHVLLLLIVQPQAALSQALSNKQQLSHLMTRVASAEAHTVHGTHEDVLGIPCCQHLQRCTDGKHIVNS